VLQSSLEPDLRSGIDEIFLLLWNVIVHQLAFKYSVIVPHSEPDKYI